MPGHTGGHSGKKGVGGKSPGPKGQKGQFGGSKKDTSKSSSSGSSGSTKGGQNKQSFTQKLKEKQKQNEINIHNAKAIKDGTAVTNVNPNTGKVSYVMNQGKIVTYSGGAAKAKKDAEKRAAELAQKELQQQGINVSLGRAKDILDQQRQRLLDRAKQNQISGLGLDRLGQLNQMFGANPTTGMGLGESLRFQGQQLAQDIPGLARAAGLITNPVGTIVGGLLTGGKGISSLAQNVLAKLRDEDVDSRPTMADITNEQPGFFEGIASALKLGQGAPFQERRFGGEQRGLAALQPPVRTGPSLMTPVQPLPGAVPITGQPVTGQILNQYLALAGFTPQEIQGMPETFRFLG